VPSGSITLASTNSGGFVQLSGQAATDARSIAFPNASGTVALTASTTGVPDKLTDGTIAGTLAINSTSYTYGTGAAAAHRTALGVSASGDTVLKSAYTPAHSLLVQQSGTGSPTSLSVGNNTILGRASGGGSAIAALSGSDARAVLGLSTLATTTPAVNVATFLESPTSANLAAAVTGETGTGALVFGTSPTLTTPTIAAINGGTAENDDITIQGTTNATRTTSYVNLQPNGGFVGVGTTSPAAKLDLSSGGVANVLLVSPNTVESLGTGFFHFSGNNTSPFFNMAGASSVSTIIGGGVNGESFRRFRFTAGGDIMIGGGSTAQDIRIFRSAADVLGVDDSLYVANSLSVGNATANAAAKFQVDSTTQGFLPPRMTTTERNAITSVPAGLMVYNTTLNKLNVYNGTTWETVTSL
jgi:hypothetical protein